MEHKDNIYSFIDAYMLALEANDEAEQKRLEDYGETVTANLTQVAQAITTLTQGVSRHIQDVEQNNELNLNILIDALYQAGMITDDVLKHIEESVNKLEETKGEEE
ncbi:hypothetical protein HOR18_gp134 [Staphylococcus phage vB_SscM-1]|uniref:Uncharacterized protein n=3 Tax=Sciuriunavirus TaxID=2732971 RepID=A0A1X9I9J7_9CAUD|nr:hypothetical protein HOR18_gp134 [Staphylococcus phage vB_SscM-1]ANT44797.1 hypothetical protein vB_SscM-1_133 [Staphylococcus phage vB_SscM-1]ANT44999.1 hypothetical protein vB_SscM-2_132 [Staphylococcus phage vB_SscM-2]QQV88519.1 hypothetical protein [Staphylococcus phage ZCSS1]